MVNLGQYLAQQLLEAGDNNQSIAIFPSDSKPPHKGHFEAVEKLLKKVDQVTVLVSPKMKDGITAEEAVAVWNLYKQKLDGSVEVRIANSDPFEEAIQVVRDNPDTEFLIVADKDSKINQIEQNSNAKAFNAKDVEGPDATNIRMAVASKNEEEIKKYLPDEIEVSAFLSAIGKTPEEQPVEPTPPPAETPSEPPPAEEPLQESPPVDDMNDDYYDYVEQNRSKVEKAAYALNFPIEDMLLAFNGGREIVLNDDMWKDMKNTKSYRIKTLEDAIAHALKMGIDPKPYIDHIKQKKEIPLPLVLQYAPTGYYLVGGEVVLSIYRSLGVIPTVLLGNITSKKQTLPEPMNESLDKKKLDESQTGTIGEFIKYAIQNLGIQKPPTGLTLSYNTADAQQRSSFGTFDPNDNKIWLYVGNRNMADILRTLAHELVHRKQAEDNRLDINSGETGSEIENEANAQAGILLRNFGKTNKHIYEGLEKFNTPVTLSSRLSSQLYELKVNEITLSPENAVEINGDVFEGEFKVGEIEYKYSIKNIPNPYKNDEGLFYGIQFDEKYNTKSPNEPTGNAKENYIKILSTIYKIILDFAEKEKPKYIGISSLNKSGYWNIYNNLSKTNKIPGYTRKDVGLDFTTKLGDKGKFVVLKRIEDKIEEGVYGDYLFGDKESGVKIGWYPEEKEEDTPAEYELFNYLKKYADSESETYSNINLDSLIPVFKKIKKQYPEIGEANVDGYIYRGTAIPEEKLRELEANAKVEPYNQGEILLDQMYASRRKVSSWSTNYFPAAGFAVTTAERKGGVPVIMRAKASDAELFFNPKFMEKLSTQLEDETFNITNPIPVDIMVIKEYKDEFEDIESGYLSTK